MKWNKWMVGLMAAAGILAAGMIQALGQTAIAVPINPSLQGLSNATVTISPTAITNGSPYAFALPGGVQQQNPFTFAMTSSTVSNTVVTPGVLTETNPVYVSAELGYPVAGGGEVFTTTDPIQLTLWAGSNAWTGNFTMSSTNRTGANLMYIDKVNSQLSNNVNLAGTLAYPN